MITVAEFEEKVWSIENVRLVVRTPQNDMIEDYCYQRQASSSSSLTDWLNGRIKPLLDGRDFYIVDGHGKRPHGRTSMANIRNTYL